MPTPIQPHARSEPAPRRTRSTKLLPQSQPSAPADVDLERFAADLHADLRDADIMSSAWQR
jgi:hypothetical protein